MVQLPAYDLMIWDLDGALADTTPDLIASFRASARAIGYGELTDEQVQNKVGGGAVKAFQRIFGEEGAHYVEPAVEYFKSYYPEHSAIYSTLYPGVKEVLEALHGRVTFAVATAKIRPATLGILEKLEVLDCFDVIVTADDIERMKPDPQSVEIVLNKTGIAPQKAVMVGDMNTDIQAAHAAGAAAIGVSWGYGKLADIEAADPEWIVDRAEQLLKLYS